MRDVRTILRLLKSHGADANFFISDTERCLFIRIETHG